jgi:hypothetical protein
MALRLAAVLKVSRMNARHMALALAVMSCVACSGSPKSPTSPSFPVGNMPGGGSSRPQFAVGFSSSPGTFSATLAGQTYTADGSFRVFLDPGTYEISGSFSADNFVIVFFSVIASGGGVQSGSVRSLLGPNLLTTPCGLLYQGSRTVSQPYRFRFTVTANPNSTCQG